MSNFQTGVLVKLARKVPAPVAEVVHEAYAHIGLIYAIVTFTLSRVSTIHVGPEWVSATAGILLFVIGKFSSARVPTSFGEVLDDASADIPAVARVVATSKKDIETVEKDAPVVQEVADAVAAAVPATAPVVAEAEAVVTKVETGPQGAALADAAQAFLASQKAPEVPAPAAPAE